MKLRERQYCLAVQSDDVRLAVVANVKSVLDLVVDDECVRPRETALSPKIDENAKTLPAPPAFLPKTTRPNLPTPSPAPPTHQPPNGVKCPGGGGTGAPRRHHHGITPA